MSIRAIAVIVWLCVAAGAAAAQGGADPGAPAQEGGAVELVRLRVSAAPSAGTAVVDRGTTDGLAVGDEVTFLPRGGRRPRGRVVQVDERSSVVQMFDQRVSIPPGTRGEVSIPVARRAPPPPPDIPPPAATSGSEAAPGAGAAAGAQAAEVPPGAGDEASSGADEEAFDWSTEDEEWEPGMPLLAQVGSVRPEQRPTKIHGRLYAIGEQIWTSDSERSTTTLRGGGALFVENPFGSGGRLQADAEVNYQDVQVPDLDGDTDARLRVDRLSYLKGGTRFADHRWEIGRFLQYGLPEFGVVDGFEYGMRTDGGNRFGASVGYMPIPKNDFTTGEDFQVAAYYRWVGDDSEQLAATAGYQKTWNEGNADRDLIVGKFHYLPVDGWNYDASVWVDLYTEGDDLKPLLEVTQAYARAGYRSEGGNGIDATYTHLAFPQIDRYEFRPVEDDQIANDHRDRLMVDSWFWPSKRARLLASLGGWVDEDDTGFDFETGIDVDDLFIDNGRISALFFGTQGAFTRTVGGRLRYAHTLKNGRWDFLAEYSRNNTPGFEEDNDDLYQTWLRLRREFWTASGWNVSIYGDLVDYELEQNYTLGFYLQKSF